MTSTVKMYKCDLCERIYGKKEEADKCQMGHICLDNLKIIEVIHLVESQFSPYGYPDIVILENIKKSGIEPYPRKFSNILPIKELLSSFEEGKKVKLVSNLQFNVDCPTMAAILLRHSRVFVLSSSPCAQNP